MEAAKCEMIFQRCLISVYGAGDVSADIQDYGGWRRILLQLLSGRLHNAADTLGEATINVRQENTDLTCAEILAVFVSRVTSCFLPVCLHHVSTEQISGWIYSQKQVLLLADLNIDTAHIIHLGKP